MVEKLNLTKSMQLYEEAKKICPGGMLGIRRPYNFVEGEYPIFIARGKGGHIFDVNGNDYMDMLCSYGPLILGIEWLRARSGNDWHAHINLKPQQGAPERPRIHCPSAKLFFHISLQNNERLGIGGFHVFSLLEHSAAEH